MTILYQTHSGMRISTTTLLKGNLFGLFYQQRTDMPAAHLAVDLQVVQVEVAEGRVLQDGKADTVAAVVCTDKDGVLGEGVEVILLVGEAHLRDGFRGKAFGPIAPAAVLVGGKHAAKQREGLVGEVDVLPVLVVDQRNGNRGKNLLSGEGTLPLFLSVRMPLLYNKSEQVYKRWGDFEKAPATKATKAQNFPNSLSIYYFKISFYKNTVLSLQLVDKWRNQAICCCTETAQNLHKLHRTPARRRNTPSPIPPFSPKVAPKRATNLLPRHGLTAEYFSWSKPKETTKTGLPTISKWQIGLFLWHKPARRDA